MATLPRKLSDEQFERNYSIFKKLFETFGPDERRRKLKDMFWVFPDMNDLTFLGSSYVTSPASSQERYHSCFPGGLLHHSLNVVSNLRKLATALAPDRWDVGTLNFVGLFHDFGKIGDGENTYYEPNDNEYGRGRGYLYEINPRCLQMPNAERGLYILQKNGIQLSSEEYLAIRLNDGPYDEANEGYSMHEPDLALLVHWADRWSCSLEKDSL